MPKVSFNGTEKIIQITEAPVDGASVIDVQADIYSAWVDWVALNLQYLPAIRFVGSDPISSTKSLGVTYFLINGWRIRPYESDHRLTLVGNLFTDPSGFSPMVPTLASHNVMIEYSVSNISDSTVQQLPEIKYSSYKNGITIDVTHGIPGTLYPAGTTATPVNNLPDALLIAESLGFSTLYVHGNLTIASGQDVSNYSVYGDGATFNITKTLITLEAGCITSNSQFHDCKITGTQGGEINYIDCVIGTLFNAHCHYKSCRLLGPIQFTASIGPTHTTDLIDCYTSNTECIMDYNGSQLKQVYNNLFGKIKFINLTNPATVISVSVSGGELTFDSTCTGGTVGVYGNVIINNTSTATIIQHSSGGGSGATPGEIWSYSNRALTVAPAYSGPTAVQIRDELDINSVKLAQIKAIVESMNIPTPAENAAAIWSTPIATQTDKTTIGGYIRKTLLTIPAFLGLK